MRRQGLAKDGATDKRRYTLKADPPEKVSKMGRMIHAQVDHETYTKLYRLCEASGTSMSETIRRIILDA